LGVDDPELLESLETTRTVSTGTFSEVHHLHASGKLFLLLNIFGAPSGSTGSSSLKEVHFVRVDDSMFALTLDLEVVGDQVDLRAVWLLIWRLRSVRAATIASSARVSTTSLAGGRLATLLVLVWLPGFLISTHLLLQLLSHK
jgi:hypothetical protein